MPPRVAMRMPLPMLLTRKITSIKQLYENADTPSCNINMKQLHRYHTIAEADPTAIPTPHTFVAIFHFTSVARVSRKMTAPPMYTTPAKMMTLVNEVPLPSSAPAIGLPHRAAKLTMAKMVPLRMPISLMLLICARHAGTMLTKAPEPKP